MEMSLLIFALLVGASYAAWVKEMENPSLFEGDMILTPDQKNSIKNGKFSYASIKTDRWPRTIPYDYDANIGSSQDAIRAIQAAISDYHAYTCLRFVRRTNEKGYLHFYQGGGCSSYVGYSGSKMEVSLAMGCWDKAVVIHEIAHALGLYHEQSRPDRDNYVEILWHNIHQGMSYNFDKQTASEIDSLGTPYDYASVMHYDSTAFGVNGQQTIRTKDSSKQNLIGQRNGFSEIDKQQINLMYQCNGVTVTDTPTTSPIDTLAPTTSGTCSDSNGSCPAWANAGYCNDQLYIQYMHANCKKSCNLCSGVGNCVDQLGSYCSTYKMYCANPPSPDWKKFLNENCPKYCAYC